MPRRLTRPLRSALVCSLHLLFCIVGLAKALHAPTLEMGIAWLDVPKAVNGIVIAALVLLPEGRPQ